MCISQHVHRLIAGEETRLQITPRLLSFWQQFHKASTGANATLTVRDLLAWATFIDVATPVMGALAAYAHGAYLVLLDGIGLGLGITTKVSYAAADLAQSLAHLEWSVLLHTAPYLGLCGLLETGAVLHPQDSASWMQPPGHDVYAEVWCCRQRKP